MKKLLLFAVLAGQATAFGQLTVTHIGPECAAIHSLFVKSDGSLWATGDNEYGQLGDGTFIFYVYKPEQIVATNVVAVAAGDEHSLFVKSDGSLWGMGYNFDGELGDGTFGNPASNYCTNKPEQIVGSDVVAVAAGAYHSLFLKSDGSLWGMGANGDGQLGVGTEVTTNRPEQIVASGVTAIAAGGNFIGGHSVFLKSDGSLWAMGANGDGQLGDGTSGNYTNKPEQIVASNVVAIAAGGGHSLFVKSDGSLWAMGDNEYDQLGDGTYNFLADTPEQIVASNVVAVAAGEYHSLFLKSDGSLWAMGRNNWGQLGDGTFNSTNKPEQIVASNVVAIAAGAVHSLFLKSDGSLWAMGYNYYGQLGDGFVDDGAPTYGTDVPEQIFPSPQPVLAQNLVSQTNLQLTAVCKFGGNFHLLASTNVAMPLAQWAPISTNAINLRAGNVISAVLTNAVNSGSQQFYILQSK